MEIKKFKKIKNNLYELEMDNKVVIQLYDDVIVKYNLLVNKNLTNSLFEEITSYNDSLNAYYLALKYLKTKLRTELEIKKYLEKKNLDSKVIKETINLLNKDGYLKHDLYLKSYVNDAYNFTNNGPDKIKYNLLKLGFKEDEINPYLDLDFSSKLKTIISKKVKINHKLSTNALKQSISHYLVNLGYFPNMFNEYLDDIKVNDQGMLQKDYAILLKKYQNKYDENKLKYFLKDKLYKKGYNIDEISEVVK